MTQREVHQQETPVIPQRPSGRRTQGPPSQGRTRPGTCHSLNSRTPRGYVNKPVHSKDAHTPPQANTPVATLQQPPVPPQHHPAPLATHQIQQPARVHPPQHPHPSLLRPASLTPQRPQLRHHHHRNLPRTSPTPVLRHPIRHHPHRWCRQLQPAFRAVRFVSQFSSTCKQRHARET